MVMKSRETRTWDTTESRTADPSTGLGVAVFCSIVRMEMKSWAFDSSAAPVLKTLCRSALVGDFWMGFRVGLALEDLGFLVLLGVCVGGVWMGRVGLALEDLGFLVLLGDCVGDLVRAYLGALDGTAVGFLVLTGDLLEENEEEWTDLVGALVLGRVLGEGVGERMGVGVGEEEG